MAYDELMRTTGASTGVQRETITADAAGGGGYKYVGPNRSGYVEITYGGLFDRTTGDETIAALVKTADDAAGTNAATVGTSTTQATNNRGVSSAATPNESLGDVRAPDIVPFRTTATQPYVGVSWDVSGTTPSVAGAAARIVVTDAAVLRSGV